MATTQALNGGNFYGSILRRQEGHGAILTDLQHAHARKLPAHSHELPFFALLLDGDYRENYRRQQLQFGPLTIAFRPAGIPHQDEIGPRGVWFFEIEILEEWRTRLEECSGTLEQPYEDCSGGTLVWLGVKLFRETRGLAPDDLCGESLLAEMLGTVACLPRESAKGSPSWLTRVLDKLEAEFCERITLDDLSKEAGVHPVHLSRVFRRQMREGVGEWVHRLRVQEACQRMFQEEMSLADIALATGFADQSHFTRAFRRVTGMSPGAFRQLVATA